MRLIAAAFSVIIVALVVACGESTGPETPFSISVTVASSTGPTFVDLDSVAQLQCDITLRATASGPGIATWGAAEYYFYYGPDRSTPLDSGVIAATEIQAAWGGSTIDSAHTQQSMWRLSASIPFGIGFAFAYTKNGRPETRTTPVKFSCGPDIPAGSSPPTFNSVAASPATGEIESGDTLAVSYSAGSAIGLWETVIAVSGTGPCNVSRVLPEHLLHVSTRSVPIVIPPGCVLGSSLNVSVQAFDAAGQGIQSRVATLTFADHTPPRSNLYVRWLYESTLGQYVLGGDSLLVSIGAFDNNALSAEFWKLDPIGFVDSLLTGQQYYGRERTIAIPDSTPSKIVMRVWSRDAAGLMSDTALAPADSIRVIPSRHHPIRESVVIPPIRVMTLDERRGLVYVLVENPPEILGVSLQSLAVTDTIPLASAGGDIDMTAGDDSLVVTLPDQRAVGLIDLTASPRTVALLPVPSLAAGSAPYGIRTLANGHAFVLVAGADPVQKTLFELDLQTGVDRVRTDVGANGFLGPTAMQRSSDHRVVAFDVRGSYPPTLRRYDLGTDTFGGSFGHEAWFEPAVDGTGAHIALGTTVFDAALNVVSRGETPAAGQGLFVSALPFDGGVLYHTMGPFGLLRDSVGNGQLVERTRLPFNVPYHLQASSDGKMLIVYEEPSSKIAVIDLQ